MTQTPPTLLSLLRSYQKACETRRSLSGELDAALSSHLSTPSTSEIPEPAPSPLSNCASEAIRPPNEAELGEVLRIGFEGLMEVKDEIEAIASGLEFVMRRIDLAKVVRRVEGLEDERLKTTIERDQLRRLAVLDPSADFVDSIKEAERKRSKITEEINEESQEIRAEIAELSAAEEESNEVSVQNGYSSTPLAN